MFEFQATSLGTVFIGTTVMTLCLLLLIATAIMWFWKGSKSQSLRRKFFTRTPFVIDAESSSGGII